MNQGRNDSSQGEVGLSSSNTLIDKGRGAEDDEQLSSVDLHGRGEQSPGASDVRVDLSQDEKGVQNRSTVVDVTHGSKKNKSSRYGEICIGFFYGKNLKLGTDGGKTPETKKAPRVLKL